MVCSSLSVFATVTAVTLLFVYIFAINFVHTLVASGFSHLGQMANCAIRFAFIETEEKKTLQNRTHTYPSKMLNTRQFWDKHARTFYGADIICRLSHTFQQTKNARTIYRIRCERNEIWMQYFMSIVVGQRDIESIIRIFIRVCGKSSRLFAIRPYAMSTNFRLKIKKKIYTNLVLTNVKYSRYSSSQAPAQHL